MNNLNFQQQQQQSNYYLPPLAPQRQFFRRSIDVWELIIFL